MSLLGTKIRNFRIVDLLGKGGMGEVYLGFDETLERKVALKSIRSEHRLDQESRARFLREARVLSQLEHPNICKIYDYIEGEESDFLVLELISGRSLRKAIQKDELDEPLKMKIADQVLRVLIAAHDQGIVHRDLKPENVMLTDDGEVKVLDFGLSRFKDDEERVVEDEKTVMMPRDGASPAVAETEGDTAQLSDRRKPSSGLPSSKGPAPRLAATRSSEVRTRLGFIMGTVGYMSPEQAQGRTATPASDMYSYGLLLQEVFTGEPPLDPELDVMARLARTALGETRPVTGLDPDLTALIERLKSVPPAARPSAVDAAERLAFVRDKPRQRRRRLIRGSAVVVLLLFAIAMTIQTVRIGREADRANREAERANREATAARQVSDFLEGLFKISDPGEALGNTITARELLDKGAERIANELEEQPLVRAQLMITMGKVYRQLGLYEPAEPLLEEAVALREELLGDRHPDSASALSQLGVLYRFQGRFDEAEPLCRRATEILEQRGPESELAAALNNLAVIYHLTGRWEEAEPVYRRALALREKALGPDDVELAATLNNLAALDEERGHHEEALELYERTLAIWEKSYGPDHPDVALVLNNMANVHDSLREPAKAEPLYRRSLAIREKTLGPDHPDVAQVLYNLSRVLQARHQLAEAEPLLRRSLAILEHALGTEHPFLGYPLSGLAQIYQAEGRFGEAEAAYRRTLTLQEKGLGPEHPKIVETLGNLVDLFRAAGRDQEAAALEERIRTLQKPLSES